VLLAVENAPPARRAWYGMFPQLGAPIGFFFSGGVFLLLSASMSDAQFAAWGWRIPFLCSSALVLIGLYVRLTIAETPVFRAALEREERARVPIVDVVRDHGGTIVRGILIALTDFVLFYLMTVFTLSWGTTALHFTREKFLLMQLFSVFCFALTIPLSALLAERGRRVTLLWLTGATFVFGLFLGPLFGAGTAGALLTLSIGMLLMGAIYGPLGTLLSELFPTRVRYTGSSVTFNLAGIFGASLAPYAATALATRYGLEWVGYYLSAAAALSMVGLLTTRETRDARL
jgi:MFS family permease